MAVGQKRQFVGIMNARNRPKVKTADDVYRQLLDAIVDQRLLPGTRLTEFSLMEAFNLSRRVIGTALHRLAWENLVVTFPNRGAFVAAPDANEARQVFAARIAMESGTTEAVARAADPAAIARLSDNLAREEAMRKAGRVREAIHLSGGFHLLMAELSGNRILSEQIRLLVARTSLVINLFENRNGLAGWHDHHGELIRLCAARRAKAAAALMSDHIRELERGIELDCRRTVSFDMLSVFGTER